MNETKNNGYVSYFYDYFGVDQFDLIKIFSLGLGYFCIIASYSILRSLKTSIFLSMVGVQYQPYTRLITILIMFPYMFLYSKMIDKLKRRHVIAVVLFGYGILSVIFALLFLHPVHGLQNTVPGPARYVGWGFEIFMDLYSALVISAFWSFVNSICTPDFANKHYGFIVGTGKVGGIISPLIGLLFTHYVVDWISSSLLAFIAGGCLIGCAVIILRLTKTLPHAYTQGYQESIGQATPEKTKTKPSIVEGLRLFATQPYVFGIFWLMFSVEIISIIFDYQMQILLQESTNGNLGRMSKFMFMYTSTFQTLGFIFAFFGTSSLLKRFGIRTCMMVMPVSLIILTFILTFNPTLTMIFTIMVILRALNYGFDFPIREMLYIPTIKDIQFKSKAWTDSFGKTFSKTSGSMFNLLSQNSASQHIYMNIATMLITSTYLMSAFFVGRKYVKTIDNDEIIGEKE